VAVVGKLYISRKETAIYKRRKNIQINTKKHRIHKVENKHTKKTNVKRILKIQKSIN